MRPRGPLEAPGLIPGLPSMCPEGLPLPCEDAGLPLSIPLDWKGLPIGRFLELMGLMLSRLPDTDFTLL